MVLKTRERLIEVARQLFAHKGVANTTISIETKHLTVDLEALLDKLRMIDGVKRLEVLGQV